MKADIHPKYNPVIFVDGEHEIMSKSTMSSREVRNVEGVDYFVIQVEVSAFSHPFYTGKQMLIDTEGRVDRFRKRYNIAAPPAPAEDAE